VSIAVTDGAQANSGRAQAPVSASLTDETIRRVRIGVTLGTGLGGVIVGVLLLLGASQASASWEYINGIAYVVTGAICFASLALTRTTLMTASELTLLFTAYFGTASVIITGAADSAIIVGLAAYTLVVLLPGIAIRTRSGRWVWINLFGVCLVYVISVLLRLKLHGAASAELSPGDIAIRLLLPPVVFCVQVLMARALNLRILEALQESERSRSALAVSNQLLEKANHNLETARLDAVKSRDDAEAASRAKSTFLANMSHELRTPLNSIIGYTEMIMDEARDHEAMRIREVVPDLKNVVLSARHLLGLIGGILDLSRIEAGRMDLVQERFEVAAFIAELEQAVAPEVRKRNNVLVATTSADSGSVTADRGKLKQVLLNLLGNACKFTTNGRIALSATYNHEQSLLLFEVRDDGIGIEPGKLAVIFEKFTQIDPSPTRRYEGAGLGLAITRELCAMMGATIDVTSKPGSGTCFTVSLPILVIAPPSASSVALVL
jgi:signal transduction histidine kinase